MRRVDRRVGDGEDVHVSSDKTVPAWIRWSEDREQILAEIHARLAAAGMPPDDDGYDQDTLTSLIRNQGCEPYLEPVGDGFCATVERWEAFLVDACGWTPAVALARALDAVVEIDRYSDPPAMADLALGPDELKVRSGVVFDTYLDHYRRAIVALADGSHVWLLKDDNDPKPGTRVLGHGSADPDEDRRLLLEALELEPNDLTWWYGGG
jgi:hypothetical protein